MFEFDDLEFKGSSGLRARAAKIRLLDGLIRLLELREEELERRISLLESRVPNCVKPDQGASGSPSRELRRLDRVACLIESRRRAP